MLGRREAGRPPQIECDSPIGLAACSGQDEWRWPWRLPAGLQVSLGRAWGGGFGAGKGLGAKSGAGAQASAALGRGMADAVRRRRRAEGAMHKFAD